MLDVRFGEMNLCLILGQILLRPCTEMAGVTLQKLQQRANGSRLIPSAAAMQEKEIKGYFPI